MEAVESGEGEPKGLQVRYCGRDGTVEAAFEAKRWCWSGLKRGMKGLFWSEAYRLEVSRMSLGLECPGSLGVRKSKL